MFALYREVAGRSEAELEVQQGETISSLMERLRRDFPALPTTRLMVAVNAEFVEPGYQLQEGDEVALLPPMSGG